MFAEKQDSFFNFYEAFKGISNYQWTKLHMDTMANLNNYNYYP